jgi:hypothetical protein
VTNQTLGYCGIATYVLSVLASATDLNGVSRAPSLVILSVSVAVLAFLVVTVARLWPANRVLASALALTQLSLGALPWAYGPGARVYGSTSVVAANTTKGVAMVVLAIAILKLIRMGGAGTALPPERLS